ncbi:hypothetical protein HDU98_005458, partial [Podochytrium sp. JEL0797]
MIQNLSAAVEAKVAAVEGKAADVKAKVAAVEAKAAAVEETLLERLKHKDERLKAMTMFYVQKNTRLVLFV